MPRHLAKPRSLLLDASCIFGVLFLFDKTYDLGIIRYFCCIRVSAVMASRAASKPSSVPVRSLNTDIDNYDVDDDIFAEANNEASNNQAQSKKRKDAPDLGIDEAIAIKKKPRDPIVKLDEGRLLSEKGIPRLRRKAQDLKFKGKGHEVRYSLYLMDPYTPYLITIIVL